MLAVFLCSCNNKDSDDRKWVGLADPENRLIRGRLLDEGNPLGFVSSAEFVASRNGAMNEVGSGDLPAESYILISVISDGSMDFKKGVSLLLGNEHFEVAGVSDLRVIKGKPIEQSIRFDIPGNRASKLLSEREGLALFSGKEAVVLPGVHLVKIRKYWIEFSDRKRDGFNYVVPFSEMQKNALGDNP
ncbi:MAG: hypothetical protein EAZ84_11755 [Verrucomicrobia bacterium]|nr:MAG: hypothetical protein EAZ84_11755 [Verrucomicrobiota bacterium]